MKIRSDFVSNSSSSSFMMVGKWDDGNDLKKFIIKNHPDWVKEYFDVDDINDPIVEEDFSYYEVCEIINEHVTDITAKSEIGDEVNNICLGLKYKDMNDDETKKQFEERIKKALSDFYKKEIDKVQICESAGYC